MNFKILKNQIVKLYNFVKGKTAIFDGFYDVKILIKSTSQEQKDDYKIDIPFIDKSPMVTISVNQEDGFAFFGKEIKIKVL